MSMRDWRHDGVRVIPADALDTNTPQTPGMHRAAAITGNRVGAQGLWADPSGRADRSAPPR